MKKFDVECHFPGRKIALESQALSNLDATAVLEKFESMAWRRLRILQLQMNGANSTMTISNTETGEFIHLIMNAFSMGEELEFRLESNIQLVVAYKDLFGLITRKNKYTLNYPQLSLAQLQLYLTAFVQGDLEQLTAQFKQQMPKHAEQAQLAIA